MIGVELGVSQSRVPARMFYSPVALGWDVPNLDLVATHTSGRYEAIANPRSLVNSAIWNGAVIHVDGMSGSDSNSGFGSDDGDFSAAKKSIHAAITAGNETAGAFRVLVASGEFEGSAFTKNGQVEPAYPAAIIGWDGPVRYRTGPFDVSWADEGGTFSSNVSSLNRVFRTDEQTENGLYAELQLVSDVATCQVTHNSWAKLGSLVHVNIGKSPASRDIAIIRNFHGARFLNHSDDFYLENIHCEGGITGSLHCDTAASRNIVGVNCSFRYSSPSNVSSPLDAVRVVKTDGLVAFFNCDASCGAKDGWSFHEDGNGSMRVLLSGCTGFENGAFSATSCNAITTHDSVISAVIGGSYGYSRNGTEVHAIQDTRSWVLGASVTARDPDGSSVSFKCSNNSTMWLEHTVADAAGGADSNLDIEANGGTVFTRGHSSIAGVQSAYSGGSITDY